MTPTDPEITSRLDTLAAVSPSRADVLDRLDQAIAIAKMGGIETRTLDAVLGYAMTRQLTPGTVACLNSVGIDTRPWADIVADVGGPQAIATAARDLGLGCSHSGGTMTITEFVLARIADKEMLARDMAHGNVSVTLNGGGTLLRDLVDPGRILAECAAKRKIIALHEHWPVLVEGPDEVTLRDLDQIDRVAMQVSRRFAWLTEREYRERFGVEPPTAPIVAALASVDADHPDYNPEWA